MADVIMIGAAGETWPYEDAGLTCFETDRDCIAERVLAERVRCEVLAMTPAALDALPAALASALRQGAWPELAIVPSVQDVRAATLVADGLRRTVASHRSLHAA